MFSNQMIKKIFFLENAKLKKKRKKSCSHASQLKNMRTNWKYNLQYKLFDAADTWQDRQGQWK